ncbi:hypothetical protein [Sphingomonas sp. VNH70]|uniref:hypothetical protein n=1 Tax=Sphingomonas silueang TaxID=3156617 RepID=UPI0032B5756E
MHGPTGRGRPLRFLGLVAGGWITLRIVLLWPEGATLPQAIRAAVPVAGAMRHPIAALPPRIERRSPIPLAAARRPAPHGMVVPFGYPELPGLARPERSEARIELALLALATFGATTVIEPASPPVGVLLPPDRPHPTFSLWAMARGGDATGGPVQLGGGQAGVRMRMPVVPDGRFALAGRLATPLAGPGHEAALGVEWRPAAPVALVVERRVALDRSASGVGLGAIAGIDRPDLPGGFALEAYGQAGAVARTGIEPYADGAVRALHPVAQVGRAELRLGIGGWGAAQREGQRIDIGPSAVLALPVGRVPVRLSLDWRQRIGGNAAPGSGPALTLGSDF